MTAAHQPQAPQAFRGQSIGMPEAGPGSLTTTGPRLAAFVVDALASTLVAALFVRAHGSSQRWSDNLPGSWSLVPLAVDYLFGCAIAGRTLGMYLFGLRLARVDQPSAAVGGRRVLLRTFLLFLFVPAVVFDRDGRGMHDRFTDTAVVRA
jgi:uncharacterized RDD family membrane protein YckC